MGRFVGDRVRQIKCACTCTRHAACASELAATQRGYRGQMENVGRRAANDCCRDGGAIRDCDRAERRILPPLWRSQEARHRGRKCGAKPHLGGSDKTPCACD